jgi:hypothetical protein
VVRVPVGTTAAAERLRTRLTTADVSPVEATPLTAARRPAAPPVAASSAALATHSFE